MTALAPRTLFEYPCHDSGCVPANDRPYSRDRNYTSVTTLIGQLDKPGLSWGAAKETAVWCRNHNDEFMALDYDEAIDKARKHHSILWREAASMGTLNHHAAVCFAKGEPFEMPADTDDATAHQVGRYIGGLTRWWEKAQPEVIASELIVRRDDPNVIGSLDMLAVIDGRVCVVDFKNTKKLDGDPYVADWGRQLGMYMACDTLCHYHGGKLAATLPWYGTLPGPEFGLIVNIMGDGRVRTFEFERDDDVALAQIAALNAVKRFKPSFQATGEIPVFEPRPDAPVDLEAML